MANSNIPTFEAMNRMKTMLEIAHSEGVHVNGGMGVALGCPFEGRIPISRLYEVIERYLSMGINCIGVADTAGVANPKQVYYTMRQLIKKYPEVNFKLHIHNTYGLGFANVLAGIQAGVKSFDSSIGGLGGCPFAPGASGNIATEDFVHMLNLMNVETGINVKKVLEISKVLEKIFKHPCDSVLSKLGIKENLYELASAKKATIPRKIKNKKGEKI